MSKVEMNKLLNNEHTWIIPKEEGFVWTCPKCGAVYVAPWVVQCDDCNKKIRRK